MLDILGIHHIAIICGDYEKSKDFYTRIMGFEIIQEVYRAERQSYKLDLALRGTYIIELFSFPEPPPRLDRPEARGLRHLAFKVADLAAVVAYFTAQGLPIEEIRCDELTGKEYTFTKDPDGLPLEFYQL